MCDSKPADAGAKAVVPTSDAVESNQPTERPVVAVRSVRSWPLFVSVATAGALIWSYWPVFVAMAQKWANDPQYSHGYLVPLFSAWLAWKYWPRQETGCRSSWWGLPLLLAGVVMRFAGMYTYFDWLEAASLLPVLAGTILLLAGPPALRATWLAIGFLVFMIPLPYRIETALSHPLQRIATLASTYILQTLGRPAISEGTIIIVNDARIGVVEACNGLGMLILFFALATAMAIVIRRSWIEKAVIVASAIPVAVAVNVIRITSTGLLHDIAGSRIAELVFHDLAGWLMMPMALGILWLELKTLSHMFIEVKRPERVSPVRRADAAKCKPTPRNVKFGRSQN